MKKLLCIFFALVLILSSVVVAGAQTADAGIDTETFDKIADYVVKEGTKVDSASNPYRITCTPYKGKTANLFLTENGDLEIIFVDSYPDKDINTSGSILLHRDSNVAEGFFSVSYKKSITAFVSPCTFNVKDFFVNEEVKFIDYTFDDVSGEFVEEDVIDLADSQLGLYLLLVEAHLIGDVGCGISDIYNPVAKTNEATKDEATKDEATKSEAPTQAPTKASSQAAGPSPKTGQETVVLAIVLLAMAGTFATAYVTRKREN